MAMRKTNSAAAKAARPPAFERGALTYSVPEAGALIGLSRNASYEAAQRGELPVMRIGSRLFVPKAALHQMLDAVAPIVAAIGTTYATRLPEKHGNPGLPPRATDNSPALIAPAAIASRLKRGRAYRRRK